MQEINNQPRVAIILVNYKNIAVTEQCLDSLSYLIYKNYTTIVVDNASKDGNEIKLSKMCTEHGATFVQSQKNVGFAGGNNIGIQHAIKEGTDYILLLNNDTLVEPDFLNHLVSVTQNDDFVGIVTALTMYYPEKTKIWYAGGDIDYKRQRAIHYGMKKQLSDKHLNRKEVSFASGCCMLIPVRIIKAVGMLPEEYFMYYEDMDYCIKMQLNGYKIIYEPKAKIYHCVSASGGGESSQFYIEWSNRSRRKLTLKYNNFSKLSYVICEAAEIISIMRQSHSFKKLCAYFKSWRNEI